MSEADGAGEPQIDEGLNFLIQNGVFFFLVLLIVELVAPQDLTLEFLDDCLQSRGTVFMHFLGALFETVNQRVLLFLLLLSEVADGQGLGRDIETLELLDVVADVVVGKQNTPVFAVEEEQVLREDVADPFNLLARKNRYPLLEALPLPKLFEELQVFQLVELSPLDVPVPEAHELHGPRVLVLGYPVARQGEVLRYFFFHDCLVGDDVHVVVVVALLFEHIVKLVVRDFPLVSHEDKQVDLLRTLKVQASILVHRPLRPALLLFHRFL